MVFGGNTGMVGVGMEVREREERELGEEQLRWLQALELYHGWRLYKELLQQAHADVARLLAVPVVTGEDQAIHNRRVGMLEGVQKALLLVPHLIQQLEKGEGNG